MTALAGAGCAPCAVVCCSHGEVVVLARCLLLLISATLTLLLLPNWDGSPHLKYMDAPEVQILGELRADEPTVLPAEKWDGSPDSQLPGHTPPLTLVAVGNNKGLEKLQFSPINQLLREETRAAFWMPGHVGRAADDQATRWRSLSQAEKDEVHKAPRRFQRCRAKLAPLIPGITPLNAPDSIERACAEIPARLSRHVRFKYAWRDAHYTDGSVKDDAQRGRLVGAAVYRTSDGRKFLINPCGKGVTNTINRAELSAIYHVLADISDPKDDVLIFTDSQVSIQLRSNPTLGLRAMRPRTWRPKRPPTVLSRLPWIHQPATLS